jgi:hypothetical protein
MIDPIFRPDQHALDPSGRSVDLDALAMAAAAAAAAAARPTWTVSDFKGRKLDQRKVVALACKLSLQGRALQLTQDLSGAQLMNAVAATPQADRDALVTEKQWSVMVPAALLEGDDDKVLTLWWNPVGHWQATHTRAAKQERVSVSVATREAAQAATKAAVDMAAVQYWANEQICRMKRVVRKLWRGSDRPRWR